MLKLAQEAIYFNLEISELMCEIFEDLGWFQDAIKDYESIKQKLPFYEKNFASFFSKINFSSISHPYKNDLSSILDKIRALDDNPTTEEIISLIEWIESTFTILNISPDQLHYCKIVFELEKKLTLESYVYPNEKKRLIIDYFAFVLEQTIRVEQMFCFGDIVLKKEKEKDLVSFVDESKICDIYEEVFNNTINISDLLILFQENGVEALSTIEFVNRYSDNENLKDGYLLGYSEDIANTYTLFCMLYGLVRWETAYKEHEIVMNQSSSHTNFFLNKISSENKKIVFLVPINVGNYMNKSNVTYKELKWLLKSIKGKNPQVKEFILVFDTYNYFPYYLFSKINYLHTHGTYLLFNQGIDKKMSEFDKKMAFAVTAAKHLLSKVISDVKLECAIRIFNENLSTYVERNIKSTYWPILEITRQYDDKIKAKQYQEECNRVLTSFFEYSDFDLFFKEVFLPTLNKKEDDIEYIKCFRSTFTEIMEDSDFICYFFYIKKFKTENYDAMFKLVKDVDDSYEESKFTDDDENSEESLASFSSKSALTMSVEKESAQKENLKNEKKTVYTMAKHKKYDWVPDDPRKYNDNDITDYKELIIKHKLGGFKSIPESNAYQFLLSQKFIDQNDENKEYFVAVTDSVDTVGANLPIDCFLDKTHQVRSPIAIALSTIIPILNNLNQDQDDVLQKQLKEYLPDGDYDDEFRENILEKLKEVNFDRESLQRMVQEAEKIFQIRDVFEELIPEMLKTDICYAKIVFPYNKTNVHWLSGEIKVAKNSHDYAIEVYAHDPYGGGQMAADNFNTLQETVERRIRAEDPQATVTCTNKVSPYKKGRQIEEDAISCGIITAEDIIKLMQCHSLDMEAPYQYGSLNLREKHCGEFATYASNTITNERFIQRFNAAKQAIGPQQQILPVIIQKPEDSMDELSSNEKHQLVELISTLKNEDLKNGITHAITNTEFYDAKDGSYFLLVRSAIEDIPVLLRSRGMEIDEEDVKAINQIHKILFKKYIAEDVIYNVGLMLIAERSKSCASQSRDSGESIQSKSSSITRYSFHSTASTTRSDENIMRTKTKPYLPRNFTF